jgi:hypothetical protein
MQRRDFLRTVILSVSTLAAGSHVRLLAASGVRAAAGDWAGEPFEKALGQRFQLSAPSNDQTVVLDRAERKQAHKIEMVSLRFTGAALTRLAEGSYPIRHADFPGMTLHLVPGTISGDVCFYRATLARLI